MGIPYHTILHPVRVDRNAYFWVNGDYDMSIEYIVLFYLVSALITYVVCHYKMCNEYDDAVISAMSLLWPIVWVLTVIGCIHGAYSALTEEKDDNSD